MSVEARSLSSLTTLASNPPAYPRNPTHVRHGPLVLYIARVPGSRDVFLSPMKPREKVVTAEDIQSSLYYVHVDQPEDARLVEPAPAPIATEPIPRKAVPTALAPSAVPVATRRKPVPGTLTPVNDFENRQNMNATKYAQYAPGTERPERLQPTYSSSSQYLEEEDKPPLPPRRPTETSLSLGTSLTLIRRDPGSTAQWNVAHIDDPPVLEVSSSTLNNPTSDKKQASPIYVEVTNPGYSKFLNTPDQSDLLSAPSSSLETSQASNFSFPAALSRYDTSPTSNPTTKPDIGERIFRRRIWMESSKFSRGGVRHRSNNSHESIGRHSPRSSSEVFNLDNSALASRPPGTPPRLSRDYQSSSEVQVSEKQPGFRGYVFMSPWNGRCEFITGVGGGSLKCRHVIPGLQGATPMAVQVSELRFNLPSSSKASTPMDVESSKRSSFFRPRIHRHSHHMSELDLSLGQEMAGGGFGGKQAKLGKLIIEDEGLKMLDLLVAANMALWWRAYEKLDAKSRGDRGSVG